MKLGHIEEPHRRQFRIEPQALPYVFSPLVADSVCEGAAKSMVNPVRNPLVSCVGISALIAMGMASWNADLFPALCSGRNTLGGVMLTQSVPEIVDILDTDAVRCGRHGDVDKFRG
jgi:hypothetical protein